MNVAELAGVDLNLLVVFAVLSEEGSVTRAAKRLGRTQSAVSHALDRLRAAVGDDLFTRTGQRMVPTARAEALRDPVARLLAEARGLMSRPASFAPEVSSRRFAISASDFMTLALLPGLAALLRREAPGVDLEVRAPASDVLGSLVEGGLDVALVAAPPALLGLRTRVLFRDRFVCVTRADRPELRHGLSLDTYLRLPHLYVSPLGGRDSFVDRALAQKGLARRAALTVPHFLVAPSVLTTTDLVATMPERVARAIAAHADLAIFEPPLPIEPVPVHAVWHERTHEEPGNVWLRGKLQEAVGGQP